MRCVVERDILYYALRYALEYDSNVLSYVIDNINKNIGKLSKDDIEMVEKEFKEADKEERFKDIYKGTYEYTKKSIFDKVYEIDEEILIYSLKYAMGRMTFAPITVIENFKHNMSECKASDELIKEAYEFIDGTTYFGMGMDKKTWMDFKNILSEGIKDNG